MVVHLIVSLHYTKTTKEMIDLSRFNETTKTVTFSNGKTLKVYSKNTKTGLRYYYYSMPRMIPISSKDIN